MHEYLEGTTTALQIKYIFKKSEKEDEEEIFC